MNSREIWRAALIAAGATGLLIAGASSPARAGDDGAAPIWVGLTTVLGLTKQDEPTIDYRERGKIVVPPQIALPPPGVDAALSNPAWPLDQDIMRARAAKQAEKDRRVAAPAGRVVPPIIKPGSNAVVTVGATAGQGPGPAPCAHPMANGACPEKPHSSFDWNPLVWVGLQKKGATVLGPEPDRDWLTDPPPGYRAPVEGVGALTDNN